MAKTVFPERVAQLTKLAEDIMDDLNGDEELHISMISEYRLFASRRLNDPILESTRRVRYDRYEARVNAAMAYYGVT
jgi:hypothetical protein